jgi:hypothetical protein
MYKFFTVIINRYPLAFLAVGCAFVLVGVTAAVPFTNLNVQNETHQLVLLLFGLLLEPISKLSEQDNEAGELDKAEEVLSVEFPADEYAALPLYPGKETLDEPASHIAA